MYKRPFTQPTQHTKKLLTLGPQITITNIARATVLLMCALQAMCSRCPKCLELTATIDRQLSARTIARTTGRRKKNLLRSRESYRGVSVTVCERVCLCVRARFARAIFRTRKCCGFPNTTQTNRTRAIRLRRI